MKRGESYVDEPLGLERLLVEIKARYSGVEFRSDDPHRAAVEQIAARIRLTPCPQDDIEHRTYRGCVADVDRRNVGVVADAVHAVFCGRKLLRRPHDVPSPTDRRMAEDLITELASYGLSVARRGR